MLLEHLPDSSRVWIFAANRPLEESEIFDIKSLLKSFVDQWQSHGKDLCAGFEIIHESIIVVAVDESQEPPSGCSIDKVFRLLAQTNIDFLQRTLLWIPFCNTVKIITPELAINLFKSGELNEKSLIINTLVDTLEAARNQLYIPLGESWMAPKINRYNQYER